MLRVPQVKKDDEGDKDDPKFLEELDEADKEEVEEEEEGDKFEVGDEYDKNRVSCQNQEPNDLKQKTVFLCYCCLGALQAPVVNQW